MLFEVAAIVLAFPLASAAHDRIAALRWVTPANTLASALVLALVLVLLTLGAWTLQLDATNRERSVLRTLIHFMRAFLIAAALFAVVIAVLAAATGQEALSPLFLGIHLAFALALLLGTRLAWRALTHDERRRARGLVDARALERAAAQPGGAAGSRLDPMSLPASQDVRSRFATPEFAAPPADGEPVACARRHEGSRARQAELQSGQSVEAPRASVEVASAAEVLDALRRCMDEVSYEPGDPNVLSMTKYVHGGHDAGGPVPDWSSALRARAEMRDPPAVRCVRTEHGDETALRISGVLDAVTAADVRPAIEALLTERRRSVSVDLSALTRIDSTGVGLIVSLFKRCRAFDGAVRISGAKDQPLAVFKLLRLDRILAPQ